MSNPWYPWFHRLCNAVNFDRVTVVNAERLPADGPVLFLGLHRNGAVDGFVYHGMRPKAVFMISTQLRRSLVGRMFFSGIEIVREKDRAKEAEEDQTNARAMQACAELLGREGELFIFPEGTSTLGPRHLPFKSGAARLLNDCLASGQSIHVVPVGIHYEQAWEWRSRVEVVIGQPISTELTGTATPLERLKLLKRRIQAGLEETGINVGSEEYLETIHRFACAATLGTSRSYFASLKALEKAVPVQLLTAWQELEPELGKRRCWYYQGLPLFPVGPRWRYVVALAVAAPVVGVAVAVNLPPLAAAAWAGRKFADGRNVVALWRLLIGMPAVFLWVFGLLMAAALTGGWWWLAGYALVTWAGLRLGRRVKKLAVAVHNGVRYPEMGSRLLALRELVLEAVPA